MAGSIRLTPGDAEAPRDQWYVIAFSNEVTRAPRARMIMGDPVVLYRREDGTPIALFDRCPHRGMRLSNGGKLIDDNIQCNYHGLQFGPDGMCRKIPSGGPISNQMRVQSYPVAEIWNWIWIWPGDPAKADLKLIPDHHALGLTDPSLHAYSGLMLEMECNYLHAYENLNEASHVSFLHHGFIDTGNVAAHPFREEAAEDRISTMREFNDEPVFPYAKAVLWTQERRGRSPADAHRHRTHAHHS
jgi:phenylpropionate dioxygenase-like ring-hydroxylating dioxygenase large terminal subunit